MVMPPSGPSPFSSAFAAKLSLPKILHIGEALSPALLTKPAFRFGRQSTGTCSCGRRALVLARCVICAREDLQELAEEAAQVDNDM